MSRIILAVAALAAAVAVPASSANAATCVYTPTTGTTASVCVESEGLAPVGGGYTSASTVWVEINGTVVCVAIGRTTVTTGGVSYNPPYFC